MVYWCLACNVPLIEARCGICGCEAVEVRLFRPEDPRPALETDTKILRETVEKRFGQQAFKRVIGDGVILLNRVPYADAGYEVVGDGLLLGHLFYDMRLLEWRFKPLRMGCMRLLEDGLMESVKIDQKPVKGQTLRLKKIDRGYVALRDDSGAVLGVAEQMDDGLKVLNVWKPISEVEPVRGGASIGDFLRANENAIRAEASRAAKTIYKVHGRFGGELVVSYSGGKDSLAVLSLTLEAGLEPKLLFTDTGIELPETVSNVQRVSSKFGVEALEAQAGEAFWRGLDSYGPPARGYRWCCKTCKLIPTLRLYKSRLSGRVLTVIGQRAAESRARRKRGSVWENYWITGSMNMTPIGGWSMLHVWLYLWMKKLEDLVNPLYFEGFDRIGCYTCPYCNLAEFQEVKRLHPELWSRWEDWLRRWASSMGYGEDYVKLALWRWRRTPKRVERVVGVKAEDYRRMSLKVYVEDAQVDGVKASIRLRLNKHIDIERVLKLAPTIGGVNVVSKGVLEHRDGETQVAIRWDGSITVENLTYPGFKLLYKVLGTIARAVLCTGCLSCVFWCVKDAVSWDGETVYVDQKSCAGCGVCLEKCPIAVYFIKESLPSIIGALNDALNKSRKS